MYDTKGKLLGLTSFYLAKGKNLNFALAVEWIRQLPRRQTQVSQSATNTLEWLNKAITLEEKKDWPALLRHVQDWMGKQPRDSAAWFNLGFAYNELKQTAQAIEAYQQALRINPEHPWRGIT